MREKDIELRTPKKGGFPSWQFLFIIMGIGISLFRFFVEVSPEKIEYGYSRAIYPFIADILSWIGKLVPAPYSASEFFISLILFGMGSWGFLAFYVSVRKKRKFRFFLRCLINIFAIIAGGYFFFLTAWGFNYLRQPFFLSLNQEPVLTMKNTDYERLATDMSMLVNYLYQPAKINHADIVTLQKTDEAVDNAMKRLIERTSSFQIPNPPPTKFLLSNELLNIFGVSGFFLPIFMEPHINSELLLWEVPFVVAHEKAHFIGFASETDANLIAYVTCLTSESSLLQYSAALKILLSLHYYLSKEKWEHLVKEELSQNVRNDIMAWKKKFDHYKKHYHYIHRFNKKMYDTYLKLNSQKEGVNSYQTALPHLTIWWLQTRKPN